MRDGTRTFDDEHIIEIANYSYMPETYIMLKTNVTSIKNKEKKKCR